MSKKPIRFKLGQSGNSTGNPKSTGNEATIAAVAMWDRLTAVKARADLVQHLDRTQWRQDAPQGCFR